MGLFKSKPKVLTPEQAEETVSYTHLDVYKRQSHLAQCLLSL